MTEENISKLKELSSWIIQSEKQRDSRKKKEQNPRDHRDLGTIANLTFIWSEFQKKKKSKPENKLCDIGIRIDI